MAARVTTTSCSSDGKAVLTGSIDGGSGTDILHLSAYSTALT